MNLWRLEWLRLVRTPRALTLTTVFVVLGLVEPVGAKYQGQILSHVGNGVKISFPPTTPVQGISSYIGELDGIGLIILVVVASGAFTFDAHHGLATFLRTRVAGTWQLVIPRFTANAAAACLAYLLGMAAAWYQTDWLIGSLPAAKVLYGVICGWIYLVFAVALTGAAASLVRGTIGTVGLTLVVLLLLPLSGVIASIHDWLPSTLADAPVNILSGTHLSHFLPSICVTIAATAALLALAAARLRTREV